MRLSLPALARFARSRNDDTMRDIDCAHVLTAAAWPPSAITRSASTASASLRSSRRRRSRAAVRAPRARQCARPRAPDALELVRHRRQAAGDLAALAGAAAGGRSVSRDRGVARALRARRRRQRDGALHPRAGPDRLRDRGEGGRARGARCRRARRLRAGAARSQSAGLRAVRADPRGAAAGGARGDRAALHPHAAAGEGADRAGRCRRVGVRERDLRRAVRPGRGAMVHAANCCEGVARGLGADRPPHPHASARDALSARLGGPRISRRHRPLSRLDRLPQRAHDAGALRLGAAGRARAARRARRHHLGQHLVEPASAFRHRAAAPR